jgi:hypothetical protein
MTSICQTIHPKERFDPDCRIAFGCCGWKQISQRDREADANDETVSRIVTLCGFSHQRTHEEKVSRNELCSRDNENW